MSSLASHISLGSERCVCILIGTFKYIHISIFKGRHCSLVYSRRKEESCFLPNFMYVNWHWVLKHLRVSTWTRSFLKKFIFLKLTAETFLKHLKSLLLISKDLYTATTSHPPDMFDPSSRNYVKTDNMNKSNCHL